MGYKKTHKYFDRDSNPWRRRIMNTPKEKEKKVDVDGVPLCEECGQGYDCVCATEPDEVK